MRLVHDDAALTRSTMYAVVGFGTAELTFEDVTYDTVDVPSRGVLEDTRALIRRVYAAVTVTEEDRLWLFAGVDESVDAYDAIEYGAPTRVGVKYSPAPQRTTYVHTFVWRSVPR